VLLAGEAIVNLYPHRPKARANRRTEQTSSVREEGGKGLLGRSGREDGLTSQGERRQHPSTLAIQEVQQRQSSLP
jgi:hypothetical protein